MINKSANFLTCGAVASLLLMASCGKDKPTDPALDFPTLETKVLSEFVTTVGTPLYTDFKTRVNALNVAVNTLADNPTIDNQIDARNKWISVREVWEQSEGFLIGPVEDDSYDPYMDTWPTDKNELNELLAGSSPLTASALAGYTDEESQLTLRGFHPLEYLLWKDGLTYTEREKEYMKGLAGDILNNVNDLNSKWPAFSNELMTPGTNSRYTSKKDALLVLCDGLVGICSEVGEGKIPDPFGETPSQADSTMSESPYSHNSWVDFKNNIIGARNVYINSYGGNTGKSLSDLVAANNKTLDQDIKAKFAAAIASFDGVSNITFEKAIYEQRPAVQNVIDAIANLKAACDGPLQDYIVQYVKD